MHVQMLMLSRTVTPTALEDDKDRCGRMELLKVSVGPRGMSCDVTRGEYAVLKCLSHVYWMIKLK